MRSLLFLFVTISLLFSGVSVGAHDDLTEPAIHTTPPAPKFTDAERQAELARRRAAVAKEMTDKSILILFSAQPKLYTNDINYVFRQENDLYYLTALKQPNTTFVLTKDGTEIRSFLFVPRRDPVAEGWYGKMYSNEEVTAITGIKTIINSADLPEFLASIKEKRAFTARGGSFTTSFVPANVYLLLPMMESDSIGNEEYKQENDLAKQLGGYKLENARIIFGDLRQIKSPYELKLLQHAIDITTEAQERAWLASPNAKMEYEVQAEVEYIFRRRNADHWGYPSIVGCGPNATILHYQKAQGPISPGSLLLMDVGAEYDHYSADVTRTIPVNGKFSKEQAEIYRIVYDAQEAVAKATKPGVTMLQLNEIANNVIKDGLFSLGLIIDKRSDQYSVFYSHSLGHWLGMNVHDVGRNGPPMRAGMVFTIEPGIYVREDALNDLPDTPENRSFIEKVGPAFQKYKNIGVRIEDDMLVTANGVEWMTKELPRKLEDVEAFMTGATRTSKN